MTNTANAISSLLWINEVNFLTGIPAYLQVSSHMGSRLIFTVARVLLLWFSLFILKWSIGRWFFVASCAMYLIEMFACYCRNRDMDLSNVKACYVLGHVSIFNFIFDRPASMVGSVLTPIVVSLNVIAITYSIFYLTYAFEFNAAWGCYGPKPAFKDLDGGYCSTYRGPGGDTSGFGSRHCINALSNSDISQLALCSRNGVPVNLTSYFHTVVALVSVSFGIYAGSAPSKIAAVVEQFEHERDKKKW